MKKKQKEEKSKVTTTASLQPELGLTDIQEVERMVLKESPTQKNEIGSCGTFTDQIRPSYDVAGTSDPAVRAFICDICSTLHMAHSRSYLTFGQINFGEDGSTISRGVRRVCADQSRGCIDEFFQQLRIGIMAKGDRPNNLRLGGMGTEAMPSAAGRVNNILF